MEHIIAIQELVNILNEAKQKVSEIVNLPDPFKIKAERALTILANSSAHSIGQTFEALGEEPPMEFGPITNFLGRDIKPVSQGVDVEVVIQSDEFQKFKQKCLALSERMGELSPKQFYDECTETEIRGVAKIIGMNVTSNKPEVITMEFIDEMYLALEKYRGVQAHLEHVEQSRKEMEEGEKPKVEKSTSVDSLSLTEGSLKNTQEKLSAEIPKGKISAPPAAVKAKPTTNKGK